MQLSTFANVLSFSVFQNTSHLETNFSSKQLYFQSSIDYTEMRWEQPLGAATFSQNFFFKTLSCLEELLLSNKYLLVINTFSDQLLLEDEHFFSTATVLEEVLVLRNQVHYTDTGKDFPLTIICSFKYNIGFAFKIRLCTQSGFSYAFDVFLEYVNTLV